MDIDDDDDDDDIGWGRPRPKFEDLLPSSPDQSDDDVHLENNMMADGGVGERIVEHRSSWRPMNNIFAMDYNAEPIERVTALIDEPLHGYVGAPLGELNQSYVNEGFTNPLKEYYTVWSNDEKHHELKYTCIFTCPITGEHFAAGNWEEDKSVTVVDGVYWYNTKKNAMKAAAAKLLDCFSLRRCHGTEKVPYTKRCVDSPYLACDAPQLPEFPHTVVLPEQYVAEQPSKHVRQALNVWYRTFVKQLENVGIAFDVPANEMTPGDDCYCAWSNSKGSPNTLFTAIFTCHLSGERFPSGKLLDMKDDYVEDCIYFDPLNCRLILRSTENDDAYENSAFERVDLVWYKTKKGAINAAAGRALDCMMYRDTNGNISDTRYCVELPYTIDNTTESWKRVSEVFDCALLPKEDRLTTRFGVNDLHALIEEDNDQDYWRARYKENRRTGGSSDNEDN